MLMEFNSTAVILESQEILQ